MPLDWREILIWAVALGVIIFLALPPLAYALGFFALHFNVDDNPAAAAAPASDTEMAALIQELAPLGFAPAGMIRERGLLYTSHWVWGANTHQFATPDGLCFAALFRLRSTEGVRIALTTMTAEEGLIRTAMPGAGVGNASEKSSRAEVPRMPLTALLQVHRANVERFVQARSTTARKATLAELAAVDQKSERAILMSSDRSVFLQGLLWFLIIPAVFFMVIAWLFDSLTLRTVPWCLLLGAVPYLLIVEGLGSKLVQLDLAQTNPPREPDDG